MFASRFLARAGAAAAAAGVAGASAFCSEDHIKSPALPWAHKGPFSAYDAAAIRRGHLVYKQVCATCHSMNRIAWRNLVGVCYTEDEAKAMAADAEYVDGPNDSGEMFTRPGKLSDPLPAPYKNDKQARMVNNGALPPDLSLMAKARHDGVDYIHALMMGYRDEPPPGVQLGAGQAYNPYFPGGKIGMPRQLTDGLVDYNDGTKNTASQMSKDVAVFLQWCAEPEQDDRKRHGAKLMIAAVLFGLVAAYHKRFRWSIHKTRQITYTKPFNPPH